MRDNGPIIISNYGAACMQYSEDFSKKMQNEGYENPFTRQQVLARKMFKKNTDGSIHIDTSKKNTLLEGETLDPTKRYITVDEWIDMRERYIADRIYQEWDWEHFTNYVTDSHKNIKDMLEYEYYKPCETGDRQCTIFCPQLSACWMKEIIK